MFSCFNIVALLMLWRCPPRKHQFTETGERNLLVVTEGLQIFSWIILFLIISLILSFLFSLSFKIVIYMVSNLRVCWFLYNYLLFFYYLFMYLIKKQGNLRDKSTFSFSIKISKSSFNKHFFLFSLYLWHSLLWNTI